jgi:hypothetical protein
MGNRRKLLIALGAAALRDPLARTIALAARPGGRGMNGKTRSVRAGWWQARSREPVRLAASQPEYESIIGHRQCVSKFQIYIDVRGGV